MTDTQAYLEEWAEMPTQPALREAYHVQAARYGAEAAELWLAARPAWLRLRCGCGNCARGWVPIVWGK